MIDIKLNDGNILTLPSEWGELNYKQTVKAFRLLQILFAGDISPFDFQVQMLLELTGFRRKKISFLRYLYNHILMIVDYPKYLREVDCVNCQQEIIQYNLVKMAERLDFAFTINGKNIELNYYFSENPFRELHPNAPRFTRRQTIETNLTAKQFADCVDLLGSVKKEDNEEYYSHVITRIAAVLYGMEYEDAVQMPREILFGITFWFTGVVKYFKEHPVYGLLFNGGGSSDGDNSLSLGMNEVVLSLSKSGYRDAANMNLLDFMDAQIKSIKDNVAKALSEGVKPEELARRTGLPYNIIAKIM